MFLRGQRDRYPRQNNRAAKPFTGVEPIAQPKPFDDCRKRRRQTMDEHDRKPRAELRERLIKRQIADPKTDHPADRKRFQGRPVETKSNRVRKRRKKQREEQ